MERGEPGRPKCTVQHLCRAYRIIAPPPQDTVPLTLGRTRRGRRWMPPPHKVFLEFF